MSVKIAMMKLSKIIAIMIKNKVKKTYPTEGYEVSATSA